MAASDTRQALQEQATRLAQAVEGHRNALRQKLEAYRELERVVQSSPELLQILKVAPRLEQALASLEKVQALASLDMGLTDLKKAIAEVKQTEACLDAIEPLKQAIAVLDRITLA